MNLLIILESRLILLDHNKLRAPIFNKFKVLYKKSYKTQILFCNLMK